MGLNLNIKHTANSRDVEESFLCYAYTNFY